MLPKASSRNTQSICWIRTPHIGVTYFFLKNEIFFCVISSFSSSLLPNMPVEVRGEGKARAPHGAKAAEVYGIVGYLLSIAAFCKFLRISCRFLMPNHDNRYSLIGAHALALTHWSSCLTAPLECKMWSWEFFFFNSDMDHLGLYSGLGPRKP